MWALLYMLLIPTFGAIYSRQTRSFVADPAVHDIDVLDYSFGIDQRLTSECGHGIRIDSYVSKQSRLTGGAVFEASLVDTRPSGFQSLSKVTVSSQRVFNEKPQIILSIQNPTSDELAKFRRMFGLNDSETSYSCDISEAAYKAVNRFHDALTGDPTAGPRTFFRMTYFSLVTVTTIGYGDILPTSDTARLLVGIEVILGIITAGLFLFTLTTRFARTMQSPPPTQDLSSQQQESP
jgi:Ion channel